jgi:hypothetical protein
MFVLIIATCLGAGYTIARGCGEPDVCALVQVDRAGAVRINGHTHSLSDVFAEDFRSSSGETVVVLCPEYSIPVTAFLEIQQELTEQSLIGQRLGHPIRLLYVFPKMREEYGELFGFDPFAFAGVSSHDTQPAPYRRPGLTFAPEAHVEDSGIPTEVSDSSATIFVSQSGDGVAVARLSVPGSEPWPVRGLRELVARVIDAGISAINIRADGSAAWGVVDDIAAHLVPLAEMEIYISATSHQEAAPFAYHAVQTYAPPPPILQRRRVVPRGAGAPAPASASREPGPVRFEACFSKSSPDKPDNVQ